METKPADAPVPDQRAEALAIQNRMRERQAHINAAMAAQLEDLVSFDDAGVYVGWGYLSVAHYLSHITSVPLHQARDQVRVAHALTELPKTKEASRRAR